MIFFYKRIICISVAPKVSPEFMARDIVVKKGDPFQIKIPYNGRPIPNVDWSNVSISSWMCFFTFWLSVRGLTSYEALELNTVSGVLTVVCTVTLHVFFLTRELARISEILQCQKV